MRKIFLDEALNQTFTQQGYVKIATGFGCEEIDQFKQAIYELAPSDNFRAMQKTNIHPQDYHCTFFDSNMEYRDRTYQIITSIFDNLRKQLLFDYRFVQANVFIKPPYKGYVAPHQNLTIVDEQAYTSISFWCPAIDTTAENGTMVLVPRSQKKFMRYRTTNISWPLLPIFKDYDSEFLEVVNVKKGELLIIDDSIIHGTTNNVTGMERFVLHAMLAPKEAKILYCEVNQASNTVDLFQAPEMFWQHYIPGNQPSDLPLWQTREYGETGLSKAAFAVQLNQ